MEFVYEDFNIETGDNKIMLSAPHCYPQYRDGNIKKRETKTGILVKQLSRNLNCSCIYKTKFYNNDPNFDEKSPYKEQLVDYVRKNDIKLLIDIHSMHSDRDVDICIGTNNGKNIFEKFEISEMMKSSLEDFGFENVFIDVPFSASGDSVISSYVAQHCSIPCFQIELNNRFLYKTYDTYDYQHIYNSFENILEKIIKTFIES